jgi:hypothetical protein
MIKKRLSYWKLSAFVMIFVFFVVKFLQYDVSKNDIFII